MMIEKKQMIPKAFIQKLVKDFAIFCLYTRLFPDFLGMIEDTMMDLGRATIRSS